MKAIWNGTVIAESNDTLVVENNHYFPADSIKKEFLKQVRPIRSALGKERHPIIVWTSTEKKIPTPLGIIPK